MLGSFMDFSKLIEDDLTPEWVQTIIQKLSPYPYLADLLVILFSFAAGAILSLVLYLILRPILLRSYRRYCKMNAELLLCIRKMIVSFVGCLPIFAVGYCVWCDGIHEWLALLICKILWGPVIFLLALTLVYAIRSFGLWHKQQHHAEQRPIDGLLNIGICFVWVAAIIIFISLLLEKNPLYLLSGLGAIAAVLLLFFQQTILFDGTVEEITLHTVKVSNWDRTLACLPISDLVKRPFINYTAMEKGGGRRIKKSILIDQRSIRFLNMEELEMLKGFDILKDYLESKETEISTYNTGRSSFNTRYLTNLGTFRIYAQRYLEQNPIIRNDMTLMVRELAPAKSGVPLEIYCFSKEVRWVQFEKVQSDILEHLLAVLPSFRLRVFQECSDIYQAVGNQVDVVGGAFRFDHMENPFSSVYEGQHPEQK